MRALRLVLVNVLVFAVLAELAALLLHYEDSGHIFYFGSRSADAVADGPASRPVTDDAVHPYFGPIHRPGARPQSNNVGFTSPHPFPLHRAAPEDYLVGIFGGSVGEYFCRLGAPRLIERLTAHRSFAGRRLVPLCFSHEGYKQPQQALVLAYFLALGQQFDLVINIDGFNEVALSTYNSDRGRDISMPSPLHLDPLIDLIDQSTLTPEKIDTLAFIQQRRNGIDSLQRARAANRLASVDFVLGRLVEWRTGQYRAATVRYAGLPANPSAASLIEVTRPMPRSATTLYEQVAADWTAASGVMQSLLTARSARYLHVLQPNQYFTNRRFSQEEAAVALNDATPFKRAVEHGYPVLVRAAAALRDREEFLDATAVFDGESAAMYADDCCHYTEAGNRVLADAIADRLLAAVSGGNAGGR